ncbi:MAG TPA: cupin domain-containing protein, partial [Pseudonocardiaceae bacterium]
MSAPPITVTADGPAPPGLSALDALLHPVPTGRFLAEHWQRRPLHLTGWPGRFGDLFGLAALRTALTRHEEAGLLVRVSGDHLGDGGGAAAHVVVGPADVAGHLRGGASVCVDGIHRADPALAGLAETLRRGLGHAGPVDVKCYLSPAGYGFNTHFDAHVVTTLQLEGRKRWRISRTPGVEFPVDNAFLDEHGEVRCVGRTPGSLRPWERPAVDPGDFVDVLLGPGDVLCLPAGTWHDAKAVDGHALALNVSFSAADVLGLLVDVAGRRLRELPAWRAGLPVLPPGAPAGDLARGFLAERVEELVGALRAALDDPATIA